MNRKLVSEILGISEKSFYRWKEERLIFKILEKYFSDTDLKEFIESNKINRFEELNLNKLLVENSLKPFHNYLYSLANTSFDEIEYLDLYPNENVLEEILNCNLLFIFFKFMTTNFGTDDEIDLMSNNIIKLIDQKYTLKNIEKIFTTDDLVKELIFNFKTESNLNYYYSNFNDLREKSSKIEIYKHNMIYNKIIQLQKEFKEDYPKQNNELLIYLKQMQKIDIDTFDKINIEK